MIESYFDITVTQMNTDATFEEAHDHEDECPLEIVDSVTGKRFRLRGFCLGTLSRDDLQRIFAYDDGAAVLMELSDNGSNGEGINLAFTTRCEEEATLMEISLTSKQAAVLGEALLAVTRLRAAQKGQHDDDV